MKNQILNEHSQSENINADDLKENYNSKECFNRSKTMSAKQLFSELNQHLCFDSQPSKNINQLMANGTFDRSPLLLLKKLKNTPQSPIHHPEGCVWNHVCLVVNQAAQVRHLSHNPTVFMWSALLHDIGKSETTSMRKGRIVSYNHDTVGMDICVKILSEMTDNQEFIYQVSKLVKYHMHPLYVNNNLPFGDVKGMKAETDIYEVALLGYCDRMGRTGSNCEDVKANIKGFLIKCGVSNKEASKL